MKRGHPASVRSSPADEEWIPSVSGLNLLLRTALSPRRRRTCPFLARRESEEFLKKPGGLNPSGRSGVFLPEPRIGRGAISKRSCHEKDARCPRPDSFGARAFCRLRILRPSIQAGPAAAGFRGDLDQGWAIGTSEQARERGCCPDGKTPLTVTGADSDEKSPSLVAPLRRPAASKEEE
jgi:hypothetical protein